jgi:hypothetical protein
LSTEATQSAKGKTRWQRQAARTGDSEHLAQVWIQSQGRVTALTDSELKGQHWGGEEHERTVSEQNNNQDRV